MIRCRVTNEINVESGEEGNEMNWPKQNREKLLSDKYKVVNHSLCPIKDKLDVIESEETKKKLKLETFSQEMK